MAVIKFRSMVIIEFGLMVIESFIKPFMVIKLLKKFTMELNRHLKVD